MSFELTPTEADALGRVIDEARRLYTPGGGPVFTAAIVRNDRIVMLARNEVGDERDPSRHAEIVAIARACRTLGTKDLSGASLIASMQPCEMCLAAMRWAGIDRLAFAMTQEAAPDFFQFPGLGIADYARASGDAFIWTGGLRQDDVAHIYRGET
ncbi:tRNA(Arg) A34 adenosine deaminase TadA [Roseivivax halotolerans]|jgi:tRNA(Arg) A34 adenosine deaminase TadA|uniref:tRNA(Arg) A34 adenosine deaminase TadA n=1 Tax=Roseivivax halotolerans TaxID=93684 RepID=A0A1I5YLA7_9RHOB|nr:MULTISPECIES: nucleoside deaminase [Roseivivax]QFT61612.1 tRNA-specific adenosine deaminase [Roseivivax sp. THAF30]SFQ44960.1 tRNA(Arg) A34 adenosine deaminase TadA [Roseivivax halotolerans]